MNRRGFLGSILALGAAPAIVRADALMRVVPVEATFIRPKDFVMTADEYLDKYVARNVLVNVNDLYLFGLDSVKPGFPVILAERLDPGADCVIARITMRSGELMTTATIHRKVAAVLAFEAAR